MKLEVNLTEEQAENLEKHLLKYSFSLNDFEIIFVPSPVVIIRSKDAEKIIKTFLKKEYKIKI